MRKIMTAIALVAALGGVAGAAPNDQHKAKPPAAQQEMHVTVTAGRGRLGFAAIQISPELRKHFGAPTDRGVLVDQVRPDSPSARAGLQVGDIITDVDGKPCTSAGDVLGTISSRKKGDVVAIGVSRASNRVELEATLEDDAPAWNEMMWNDPFGSMFDGDLRNTLDQMRKRIEELEHGSNKLGSGSRT